MRQLKIVALACMIALAYSQTAGGSTGSTTGGSTSSNQVLIKNNVFACNGFKDISCGNCTHISVNYYTVGGSYQYGSIEGKCTQCSNNKTANGRSTFVTGVNIQSATPLSDAGKKLDVSAQCFGKILASALGLLAIAFGLTA